MIATSAAVIARCKSVSQLEAYEPFLRRPMALQGTPPVLLHFSKPFTPFTSVARAQTRALPGWLSSSGCEIACDRGNGRDGLHVHTYVHIQRERYTPVLHSLAGLHPGTISLPPATEVRTLIWPLAYPAGRSDVTTTTHGWSLLLASIAQRSNRLLRCPGLRHWTGWHGQCSSCASSVRTSTYGGCDSAVRAAQRCHRSSDMVRSSGQQWLISPPSRRTVMSCWLGSGEACSDSWWRP